MPDDGDALVTELLLRYPEKPSERAIADFLRLSERLYEWFRPDALAPRITRINLDVSSRSLPRSLPQSLPLGSQHPAIDTLDDLADWLTVAPQDLEWLADLWRFDAKTPGQLQHYRYQLLEKRDGKKRLIEKPKATLKRLQRQINQEILATLEPHPAVHGFCKHRSCLTHASAHVAKQYLLLFDIAECFQSIHWSMVKAVFKRMGYTDSVCVYLTALCTHSVRLSRAELRFFDVAQQERLKQRHLPQGAPSSPALANAALQHLDTRLSGLADRFGLSYSRYADDIAMSSNQHRDWCFLQPLIGSICLEEGVALNYRKTRIKKAHQKQRLVGIVVNQKTNVDRKYFDNLKAILTNCVRHGLESQNSRGHPHFRAHLLGKIQYVKSLNPQKGLKLERLFHSIDPASDTTHSN